MQHPKTVVATSPHISIILKTTTAMSHTDPWNNLKTTIAASIINLNAHCDISNHPCCNIMVCLSQQKKLACEVQLNI